MSDQSYPGVAPLSAFTNDFNRTQFHISQLINQIVTMTLVKVVAVHVSGLTLGTVDVQPLVSQVDGSGQPVLHGVIYGLPYLRFQAGSWAIIIDPQVGDIGVCGFCMRDISKVKATLDVALPGSMRTYDWGDGVYFGACLSNTAPTQYIQNTSGGINIVTTATVSVTAGTATVTANKVDLLSNNVNLGAEGGAAVARVGDTVAGGVITSGSSKVKCA